jgi:hypothetical protein
MLDFIWHLRGSIQLEETTTNAAALDGVIALLKKQRKPVLELGPNAIVFNDPIWSAPFGPNWLAMVIYDRGRFWIEQRPDGRRLCYELRSLHGMVFCLLAALMFMLFGLASGGLLGGVAFAAFAFGWLYGMNVLLASARVPGSIRKAAHAS